MIPFALAGLVTATIAAKAHYDQKQQRDQRSKELAREPATPEIAYVTQEQMKALCIAVAQLQAQVVDLQGEMKTKVTFH